MRKIAVYLPKGGVGKTTTAINIACGLAKRGKRVLLVDCDTQGHVKFFLGQYEDFPGLAELIISPDDIKPDSIAKEVRPNLYILAGGRRLSEANYFIGLKQLSREKVLSKVLKPFEKQNFDFLIMDLPPAWDLLTINALFYSNELVVPISLEMAAIQGLAQLNERLDDLNEPLSDSAAETVNRHVINYLVPTMLDRRSKESIGLLRHLSSLYEDEICYAVRRSVRVFESAGYGKSIEEYDPTSPCGEDYSVVIDKIAPETIPEDRRIMYEKGQLVLKTPLKEIKKTDEKKEAQ